MILEVNGRDCSFEHFLEIWQSHVTEREMDKVRNLYLGQRIIIYVVLSEIVIKRIK